MPSGSVLVETGRSLQEAVVPISDQLTALNSNLTSLIRDQNSLLNSPLLQTIAGGLAVLLATIAIDYFKNRSWKINKFYDHHLSYLIFYEPKAFYDEARITSYPEEVGDKPMSEKMVIELRKKVKYWYLPRSRIKKLFSEYEAILKGFPSEKNEEVAYLNKAKAHYSRIEAHFFAKTGENEWTD